MNANAAVSLPANMNAEVSLPAGAGAAVGSGVEAEDAVEQERRERDGVVGDEGVRVDPEHHLE